VVIFFTGLDLEKNLHFWMDTSSYSSIFVDEHQLQ